jgi:hypothetical protein
MKTNVYKRFDPRVMESEERIGINRGLPTMQGQVQKDILLFVVTITYLVHL